MLLAPLCPCAGSCFAWADHSGCLNPLEWVSIDETHSLVKLYNRCTLFCCFGFYKIKNKHLGREYLRLTLQRAVMWHAGSCPRYNWRRRCFSGCHPVCAQHRAVPGQGYETGSCRGCLQMHSAGSSAWVAASQSPQSGSFEMKQCSEPLLIRVADLPFHVFQVHQGSAVAARIASLRHSVH